MIYAVPQKLSEGTVELEFRAGLESRPRPRLVPHSPGPLRLRTWVAPVTVPSREIFWTHPSAGSGYDFDPSESSSSSSYDRPGNDPQLPEQPEVDFAGRLETSRACCEGTG